MPLLNCLMINIKNENWVFNNNIFGLNEFIFIVFVFVDKLRALLTLLRIVTSNRNSFTCDDECVSYVSNKLLHFIAAMKSLAQTGSNFNKNCLLTVGNIMNQADDVSRGLVA